ncbi:MAG: hypothetical protein FWD14_01890 [Treponema sp.]|nr:hypothetical protein [Treponema sp.]
MISLSEKNKEYEKIIEKTNTNILIGTPDIGVNGFSVKLYECIDDISSDFELYVYSKDKVILSKDAVTLIIASLILKKYKRINIAYDVGENTLKEVEYLTKAFVTAKSIREDNIRIPRINWSLNFSGGMDSTALRYLCPELITTSTKFSNKDFLPDDIFKDSISSLNIVTNANEFLLANYSYGMFALSSLVHSDSLGIKYIISGKNMLDGWTGFNFLTGKTDFISESCSNYDTKVLYPIIGLNAIATQNILYKLSPETYNNYFKYNDGTLTKKWLLEFQYMK